MPQPAATEEELLRQERSQPITLPRRPYSVEYEQARAMRIAMCRMIDEHLEKLAAMGGEGQHAQTLRGRPATIPNQVRPEPSASQTGITDGWISVTVAG
jgi:hypothetical protein